MAFITSLGTYKWDTASNEPVPWALAWTFADDSAEIIPKIVHKVRPKGKLTSSTVSVYGVTPDSVIDVNDLATGANAQINIALDNSTEITQYAVKKVRCKNLLMETIRIDGTSTYDGTGVIDQVHEVAVDLSITGQQR